MLESLLNTRHWSPNSKQVHELWPLFLKCSEICFKQSKLLDWSLSCPMVMSKGRPERNNKHPQVCSSFCVWGSEAWISGFLHFIRMVHYPWGKKSVRKVGQENTTKTATATTSGRHVTDIQGSRNSQHHVTHPRRETQRPQSGCVL